MPSLRAPPGVSLCERVGSGDETKSAPPPSVTSDVTSSKFLESMQAYQLGGRAVRMEGMFVVALERGNNTVQLRDTPPLEKYSMFDVIRKCP